MAGVLGIGWTGQVNSERWHRGGVKADLEPHGQVGILAPAPPGPDLTEPQWPAALSSLPERGPIGGTLPAISEVSRAPPGGSWSPAEA